jgi:hypothetical protein
MGTCMRRYDAVGDWHKNKTKKYEDHNLVLGLCFSPLANTKKGVGLHPLSTPFAPSFHMNHHVIGCTQPQCHHRRLLSLPCTTKSFLRHFYLLLSLSSLFMCPYMFSTLRFCSSKGGGKRLSGFLFAFFFLFFLITSIASCLRCR